MWYVFALIDAPPRHRLGRGLGAALSIRRCPGGFAVVERRADVPPLEMGTLEAHERVVMRIWESVPAVVPVRFGTLIDEDELRAALAEREEELAEAFDVVRGMAQFTWRPRVPARAPRAHVRPAAARSGADYLRRAAQANRSAPPRRYAKLRDAVRDLVMHERFEPASPTATERLYHLVARTSVDDYRARSAAAAGSLFTTTGPWPPHAFVPDLL